MKITEVSLEQYTQREKYTSFAMQELNSTLLSSWNLLQRNSFFQILLIRKGTGTLFIDFNQYTLKSPCVCFIFPQQVYRVEISDPVEGDAILFDHTIFCSEILSNELKEYNIDLHSRLNYLPFEGQSESFNRIEEIRNQIVKLERPLNDVRKIEIKFLTKIIIFKILDRSQSALSTIIDNDIDLYIQFRQAVDQHFHENRKVENYCKKIGISSKKLNLLCKKHCHKTALEIIHERLSLEIKKIFSYEEVSLKETAFKLGFDSQSALNKYIANKFGCTPKQLKLKIQESFGQKV